MGLAFIPVYIKYLGIESFGLIGLFSVIQAWLTILDFGMTPTINREMARYTAGSHTSESIKDLLRSLELICIFLASLIIFLVWFISGWLASHWLIVEKLPLTAVSNAIQMIGIVVALRFVEGLYRSAIIGLQKQVWLNVILSISATLRWAGAAVVVFFKPDVNSYFIWHALVSLLTIIVFYMSLYKWLPLTTRKPKFSLDAIKNVWDFARGMLLATFLALLLTQIDKVLLSKLVSLESFGYYTLAATIVGILYQITIPITQAYYPRMTEQVTNNDITTLTKTYHQASQLVTVLLVPLSLMFIFYSNQILLLWTNNAALTANVAPILSILAFGTMLNGIMYMPYMLQLANGWSSFVVKVNTVAVLFLLPAIIWAAPKFGAVGAAWCWAALNLGYLTISMHFMFKRLLPKEKWVWYFQDLALPSIFILAVILLSRFLMPDSASNITQLLWMVISWLISFVSALFFASKIPTKSILNKLISLT